jgi:murein L,D-transpeptidase YcbB/YkuD
MPEPSKTERTNRLKKYAFGARFVLSSFFADRNRSNWETKTMMKWQLPIIVAVILNVLVLYPPPASAVSASNYKDIFVEHLELGPASYLKLNAHGKSADDIDKALTEIYYENGLQPFWIEEGRPGSRAADILAVLEEADSHGLDPVDYFVDQIHQYWDSKDATVLVRLDLLL